MKYSHQQLRDFFEGKLSRHEAKSVMDWMHSAEGEAEMGSLIEEVWKEENQDGEIENSKNADPTIKGIPAVLPQTSPSTPPRKSRQTTIWLSLAAAVALLLTFGFVFFSQQPNKSEAPIALEEEPLMLQKSTNPGQRKVVVLPDGSRVTLNAGSRIEYRQDFATNRSLRLEGEAFFEVTEDAAHPFSVVSHGLTTTALGTSFNIKAYGANMPVQVTLATGKVKVEDNFPSTPTIMMEPGEGIRFDPENSKTTKSKVDLKWALSWQDGILHFEKVPFNDILGELERWYGVHFEVPTGVDLPTIRCSGTFGPNEYLNNVLEALSHSVNFTYEINEKTVLLEFNKTKPMKHPS